MLQYCNAMAGTASVASGASNASHTISMVSYPLNLLLEMFLMTGNICIQAMLPYIYKKLHLQCSTASEASKAFHAICARPVLCV